MAPALRSGDSLIMGQARRTVVSGQSVRRHYTHHHFGRREGFVRPGAGLESSRDHAVLAASTGRPTSSSARWGICRIHW